jgi:hypothetical protein
MTWLMSSASRPFTIPVAHRTQFSNSDPIQSKPNRDEAKHVIIRYRKSVALGLNLARKKGSRANHVYAQPNSINIKPLPPKLLHRNLDLLALANHVRTAIPRRAVHRIGTGTHDSDPTSPSIIRCCQIFNCAADKCCNIWPSGCSSGRRGDDMQAQRR